MGPSSKKIEIVLAIDIGGTYTKIGLVEKNGTIRGKRVFSTGSKHSFQGFVLNLEDEVALLCAELKNKIKIV
ncbi:MAG: glucokinase, partial [Sediminicola sp.]